MDDIIKRYCPRIAFDSYEDMKEHFTIDVPEDFNFGFDVVDAWAELEPTKQALLWTNDAGDMKRYTFADMKAGSNRAANFFKSKGIRKGDYVMLILKQRPEVWMCFTALHKIGAVVIPASFQLTPHDLVYRLNAAGVKMLVTVDDAEIIQHCEDSLADCPTVETYAVLGEQIPAGAVDFAKALAEQSDVFERPTGEDSTKVTDTMLLYFSSGTTGMPKMVRHDYSHPLGQITTARFWQCVQEKPCPPHADGFRLGKIRLG